MGVVVLMLGCGFTLYLGGLFVLFSIIVRNLPCALQVGLSSLLLVHHSPMLGGSACCACGLQVQAGRAVSDLRPLSCLMHLLLMQIQLQSRAAWFW